MHRVDSVPLQRVSLPRETMSRELALAESLKNEIQLNYG